MHTSFIYVLNYYKIEYKLHLDSNFNNEYIIYTKNAYYFTRKMVNNHTKTILEAYCKLIYDKSVEFYKLC